MVGDKCFQASQKQNKQRCKVYFYQNFFLVVHRKQSKELPYRLKAIYVQECKTSVKQSKCLKISGMMKLCLAVKRLKDDIVEILTYMNFAI
ncbi:transposase [Eubacterium limosum]|uniref:transposase n=1 Tax=Eubacterium limosum TaxID=1736 RepID=UPI0022E5A07D|nr:transposase [Eubacterium limosum]